MCSEHSESHSNRQERMCANLAWVLSQSSHIQQGPHLHGERWKCSELGSSCRWLGRENFSHWCHYWWHGSEGLQSCFQRRQDWSRAEAAGLQWKAVSACPKFTPSISYSKLLFASHTPAEVISSWLTSACDFRCHQVHPYASCLLSSDLFEIWMCWINLQYKRLCPIICLWWRSLIELFSRKNKRLWWPMWKQNREVRGCPHCN